MSSSWWWWWWSSSSSSFLYALFTLHVHFVFVLHVLHRCWLMHHDLSGTNLNWTLTLAVESFWMARRFHPATIAVSCWEFGWPIRYVGVEWGFSKPLEMAHQVFKKDIRYHCEGFNPIVIIFSKDCWFFDRNGVFFFWWFLWCLMWRYPHHTSPSFSDRTSEQLQQQVI